MISDKRAKLAFHHAQILPNWWTIFQAMLKPYPFHHFEATLPPYFIQKLTVKPFSHILGFPGQLSSKRPKVTWPAPWRLIVLVSMSTPSPSTFPLHRKLSSAISLPWALDKLQWMLSMQDINRVICARYDSPNPSLLRTGTGLSKWFLSTGIKDFFSQKVSKS